MAEALAQMDRKKYADLEESNQHFFPVKRKAIFLYLLLRETLCPQHSLILFFLYLFQRRLHCALQWEMPGSEQRFPEGPAL